MLSSPSLVYVGRISHYSFPSRKVADRLKVSSYTNLVPWQGLQSRIASEATQAVMPQGD